MTYQQHRPVLSHYILQLQLLKPGIAGKRWELGDDILLWQPRVLTQDIERSGADKQHNVIFAFQQILLDHIRLVCVVVHHLVMCLTSCWAPVTLVSYSNEQSGG